MGNWSYNPTYRSYNPIYNWKGAHLVCFPGILTSPGMVLHVCQQVFGGPLLWSDQLPASMASNLNVYCTPMKQQKHVVGPQNGRKIFEI